MKEKSIPGWTIEIKEISNGVYMVTLADAFGRKAEVTGLEYDEAIERAISDAFDMEKQISRNWNLFLYDFTNQKLNDTDIENKEYNDKAFGSWIIGKQDKRLIYEGKDSLLILQTRSEFNWTDIDRIKKDDLKYINFVRQIIRLK
jgi:hypothetical protein